MSTRNNGFSIVASAINRMAVRSSLNLKRDDAYKINKGRYEQINGHSRSVIDAWIVIQDFTNDTATYIVVDRHGNTLDPSTTVKRSVLEDVLLQNTRKDGAFYTGNIAAKVA